MPYAAGSAECLTNVFENDTSSAILHRTVLTNPGELKFETVEVSVKRLDSIIDSQKLSRPSLLKIDTEGYELNVLLGAKSLIKNVDYIIVEVSILKRFNNSYEFFDIVNYLKSNGFSLHQILTANKDNQGLVRYCDLLFWR